MSTKASACLSDVVRVDDRDIMTMSMHGVANAAAYSFLALGIMFSPMSESQTSPAGAESPAPPVPKLPKNLKGSLDMINPSMARHQSNSVELRIDTQEQDKVTGAYTRHVQFVGSPANRCVGAFKLPFAGTYDGEKLTITVKYSNNGAMCEDRTMWFSRGKEHYFERQAEDGSWKIYFDLAD